MNIFYLHRDPLIAATMHCDQHCVKMILETAQLLSTAHRVLDGNDYADENGLYKSTHVNHPSAIWVRSGIDQYKWTHVLLLGLLLEYKYRYKKIHAASDLIGPLSLRPENIPLLTSFNEPPQCFGEGNDHLKGDNTIEAYRRYYRSKQQTMKRPPRWNYRPQPEWW